MRPGDSLDDIFFLLFCLFFFCLYVVISRSRCLFIRPSIVSLESDRGKNKPRRAPSLSRVKAKGQKAKYGAPIWGAEALSALPTPRVLLRPPQPWQGALRRP